jgi:hypothetical protein
MLVVEHPGLYGFWKLRNLRPRLLWLKRYNVQPKAKVISEESKETEGEEDFDVILAAAERVQQKQF